MDLQLNSVTAEPSLNDFKRAFKKARPQLVWTRLIADLYYWFELVDGGGTIGRSGGLF